MKKLATIPSFLLSEELSSNLRLKNQPILIIIPKKFLTKFNIDYDLVFDLIYDKGKLSLQANLNKLEESTTDAEVVT